MAELFTLLENGVLTEKREIVENLNPNSDFLKYIRKFFPEEVYNLNENSNLYKLLVSLLGDSGVLGVKKAFLAPKLYANLMGTNFNDIDSLFFNVLQLPRIKQEMYDYDPYSQLLTEQQWAAVRYKDSSFKNRSQDFMRYFQYGNSLEGIEVLAKSIADAQCYVFPRWTYLDDIRSDEPIGIQDIGLTNSFEEIVILPQLDSLSVQEKRRITSVLNKFTPVNALVTIDTSESNLTLVNYDEDNLYSTSNYFYVNKKVTGNANLDYSYAEGNNWIENGQEKDAPHSAFSSKSETVNTISVLNVTASSYHTGAFNNQQKQLFEHLSLIEDRKIYSYTPQQALSTNLKNNLMTSPWVYRQNVNNKNYVIDESYPVGYFSDRNYSLNTPNSVYWASEEKYPDLIDSLELDLVNERPVNNIDFEISQKPIDIRIYYWTLDEVDNEYYWQEVSYRTDIETNLSVFYGASKQYSWQYLNPYFDLVQTSKLKIEFQRREDPFPFPNSNPLEWSIEVKNLRVLHSIANISDFVADSGVDILGNSYSTNLVEYSPNNSFKLHRVPYWKSQVNPDKFAVEAIYFDIRDNSGDAVFIDEIFIDPLTPGCLMHIYYSDDAVTTNWDNKLWTPVSRHYTLSKGNVKLPETIKTKFIKLEFTNLSATPYDFTSVKDKIVYRMYPTWVEDIVSTVGYINDNKPLNDAETFSSVDPSFVNMGIVKPDVDKLTPEVPRSIIDFIDETAKSTVLDEYQISKFDQVANQETAVESINFYPNEQSNLYQTNLIASVKDRDRNTRFNYLRGLSDPSAWTPENPILNKVLLNLSSKEDRFPVQEEKTWPEMWFMKRCRHGYKLIETERVAKVGYFVAIKNVKFYKKDKTKIFDDFNYVVTLSDSSTEDTNDFYETDWRWTLDPDTIQECGSNNVVQFSSENFDGVAF